ncbi:class C beta-lactamase-related serine hydrolase [Corallococcus praedator]|uniref:Class C beta-lactamase-related serine hydrolase n=1 Tax=Corallococcus praedator TaxID=2316724 RepID=A0ABX9QJS4_9BACT|nr:MULTISPECIES: serine hydrolase [Corallococcus]RKH28259.1 class C beta-lactamase-related serine hydrolase [Corallococcus sp. CA031C]RKI07991.1 class C beta-lactamase-related serine hydrolase [Corallococcus praedator]
MPPSSALRFLGVSLLGGLLLASPGRTQPPSSSDAGDPAKALVGIWGGSRGYGPELQGALTLSRAPEGWRASIGGFSAPGRLEKQTLTFTLPGGQGGFRGTLTADGKRILGHWLQPRALVGGVRYATPVELRVLQKDVWRGDVTPLEDRFTLYLLIQEMPDGAIHAILRNPEKNLARQAAFRVSLKGHDVQLIETRPGGMRFNGTYDADAGKLTLNVLFLGALDLTRRDRDQAVGLYPRTPAEPVYTYRKPTADGDGWATASLAEVGMDEAPIRALVQGILDTQPGPTPTPLIEGLLIARHGKLVVEEYFHGQDSERPHDLRSASKTFAPVLVGAAIQQGAKLRPETLVSSLFPGAASEDPRKARVTVEHLMTMTSGLACDDNDDSSPGNENTLQDQPSDWYAYTLNLPMAREPGGGQAVYCSAGINLLGGVLHQTTGTWLPELFERAVATPLQMRRHHINLTPDGDAYLGGGLYLRPRDALKLGQLYLSGGVWNGRRVIPRSWVERSTARHAEMSPGRTYGYAWWRHELKVGDRVYAEYEAGGNGGQYIMVVPELGLTVAFTGANYGQFALWKQVREDLLPRYILAAARP